MGNLGRTAVLLLVGLVGVLASPGQAEARRGLAIINTGADVFEAGELPESLISDAEPAGWKAGYRCEVFGVFWAYLFTWDCKPVVFKQDAGGDFTYDNSAPVAAAVSAVYSESDMKMGWWKGGARWGFLGLIILFGGLAVLGKDDEDEDEEDAPSS